MSFDVPALLTLFFLSTPLQASDVILVTAEKIPSYNDKSTSDVKIITAEEIKNSTSRSLPEILSKESDLSVVSSGPNGSNASLFLRGTDSSHTLVVIDGIVMNDPSNPNRQFDLGRLSLNNIERIEILKGSQGLGFGSNAIGGVIVITTKKAKSTALSGGSYLDYGSFDTVNAGANFQKKYDLVNLSFGADYMDTDGFSAANENVNPYADKDGAQRVGFSLGANKDLSGEYSMDLNLRYSHNSVEIDKGGGAGNDSKYDHQKEEELYSKIELTKNWDSGNAQTMISYNRSKHYRLLDLLTRSAVSSGELNSINANHTYYINEFLTQNLNLEFSHEKDQTEHFNQNWSGFLYHQLELPSNIFNFGVRLDHNKYFNDHLTYKLAAAQKFNSALLKLSHSTGFRAPSLNQLYDPTYGNKNLNPETSKGVDLSLEQSWTEEIKTTTTLFYTKLFDRLSYDPVTFINKNFGDTEILGAEENIKINWNRTLTQSLAFTLLKTQNLARRPEVNIKNQFSTLLGEMHHIDYELFYVGKRPDVDNLGNAVVADAYFLSNLNYRYVLNEVSEFYFKIKNVFDTDYEEIYGFGTGGRAFTAGAQYSF